jgi:FkbM family methyltransferase
MLIDNVRNLVQRILPSRVFGAVFGVYSSLKTAAHIGIKDCIRLRSVAKGSSEELAQFHFPGTAHPVYVRPGSTDADIAEAALIRQYHACLRPKFPVSLIVDAGAYAGYTTVFFANRYPDTEIIALEPDTENYSLAQMNLSPYGERVKLLNAAVWYRSGPVRVLPDRRFDSTQVGETTDEEGYSCTGLNMMSLLEKSGQQRISIFKCDIEGAEEFIFNEEANVWIEQTDSILMEIHSARAHEAVYSVMQRHPFKVFTNRELHVFFRASPSRSLLKSKRGNLHRI